MSVCLALGHTRRRDRDRRGGTGFIQVDRGRIVNIGVECDCYPVERRFHVKTADAKLALPDRREVAVVGIARGRQDLRREALPIEEALFAPDVFVNRLVPARKPAEQEERACAFIEISVTFQRDEVDLG